MLRLGCEVGERGEVVKRWHAMAFLAPWSATVASAAWLAGVYYGAPSAPSQAPYRATVILPAQTVFCAAGSDALTFERAAITLDCSADRVFASGFEP